MIRTILSQARIEIPVSWSTLESFDDFVIKSRDITDDDLLVVVSSRRASVSFDSDMDSMPEYLRRYFATTNLVIIYPSQFGTETPMTMAETMATDLTVPPSTIYLWALDMSRAVARAFRKLKR